MKTDTKHKIIQATTKVFALYGYEGLSIRTLAQKAKIAPSVLYHYFRDKDELLKIMFDEVNRHLGIERAKLPQTRSIQEMLKQRIEFQLDHAEEIVSVLKFYLAYRRKFKQQKNGFVPDKAYLHIEEVLQQGIKTGEISSDTNIREDAKVVTHAINGFLLEYYPHIPKGKEKKALIGSIYTFLWRGIRKGGE